VSFRQQVPKDAKYVSVIVVCILSSEVLVFNLLSLTDWFLLSVSMDKKQIMFLSVLDCIYLVLL